DRAHPPLIDQHRRMVVPAAAVEHPVGDDGARAAFWWLGSGAAHSAPGEVWIAAMMAPIYAQTPRLRNAGRRPLRRMAPATAPAVLRRHIRRHPATLRRHTGGNECVAGGDAGNGLRRGR